MKIITKWEEGKAMAKDARQGRLRYLSRPFDAALRRVRPTFAGMTTGVKDLKLWQEAVGLGGDVLRLARTTSRRETRAYSDELIRSALAIGISIAEGYGQYDTLEQRSAYRAARRDLGTLETQLAIGRQGGVIPAGALTPIATRQAAVGRLLSGYLAYVERQVDAERLAEGARAIGRSSSVIVSAVRPGPASSTHEPLDEVHRPQARE